MRILIVVVKRLFVFVALSLIMLEISVRLLVATDLLHPQVALGRYGAHQLEDIIYDGYVVKNTVAAGAMFRKKTISAYSGYYGTFDYTAEANRILIMGSSYTEGWSPKYNHQLYAKIASKQLTRDIGMPIQFADASANSLASLFNTYAIYGNKIINKNVAHDVVIVELALANFNPIWGEVVTLDTYTPIVWNEGIAQKAMRHFYSFRFLMLSIDTISFGVLKLDPPFQRKTFKQTKEVGQFNKKMRAIYTSNRPSFDIQELRQVDARETIFAEKLTRKVLGVEPVFKALAKINDLAKKQGMTMVLLLFPEFLREELITIVREMDRVGVAVIYLDNLREYTNGNIWQRNHPYTPIGQKLMGDGLAEGLKPILKFLVNKAE